MSTRNGQRWFPAYNDSDEAIPGFALVYNPKRSGVLGAGDSFKFDGEQVVVNVKKPNNAAFSDQDPSGLWAVDPDGIAPRGYGMVTQDWPAQVLLDSSVSLTGGFFPITERPLVGPKSGSFGVSTLGGCFRLVDLDSSYFMSESGEVIPTSSQPSKRVWISPQVPLLLTGWGKATTRWQNGNDPYVEVNPSSDLYGTTIDTSQVLAISLPRRAGGDPNVRQNDIIAYQKVGDQYLCISPYIDDKVGTIKMWINSLAGIPAGWALANGVDNSIGNGGSGENLTGRFPVGYKSGHAQYFQIGNTGGSDSHTHGLGALAGIHSLAGSAGAGGSGYLTDAADSRPAWYCVALIERIL